MGHYTSIRSADSLTVTPPLLHQWGQTLPPSPCYSPAFQRMVSMRASRRYGLPVSGLITRSDLTGRPYFCSMSFRIARNDAVPCARYLRTPSRRCNRFTSSAVNWQRYEPSSNLPNFRMVSILSLLSVAEQVYHKPFHFSNQKPTPQFANCEPTGLGEGTSCGKVFKACWGNGAHFRDCLYADGFIPAFARCCFCIAISLLVFTSPLSTKFNPWIFLPNTH